MAPAVGACDPISGILASAKTDSHHKANRGKLSTFRALQCSKNAVGDYLARAALAKSTTIARNCYPSIEKGLRRWAEHYPEFAHWEVLSAGVPHPPMTFGPGRKMMSLGKLSLEDYGAMLRTTAVGLSLMASPHPSYPPLEMAHFGLRTVTNRYANKDLTNSHPNIFSTDDVAPNTIADALAAACRAFEAEPTAGWLAQTRRPSFLEPGSFPFLDDLAGALTKEVWGATP